MKRMKREPKRGLTLEFAIIEDLVRGLKRCENETQQLRTIGAAFAYLRSARSANVEVEMKSHGRGVTWT